MSTMLRLTYCLLAIFGAFVAIDWLAAQGGRTVDLPSFLTGVAVTIFAIFASLHIWASLP